MPDPVKAPPLSLVDEIKTSITTKMWEKYNKEGSKTLGELHKRDTKMITDLISQLANLKAFLEHNKIEIK